MSCPPLTNKGGKLSISRLPVPCELTLPELAMLDYVVVPGVGSIGDTGIEQEISSYSTSNAGLSPQSKGAAVGKAWDVEMLESQSEARDILEAASAAGNKDTYATRIEWPDGVVEFSIVQVSSPTYVKGAPSGVRIVRYTMVPSFVPIVKNPLQAPVLYAPMYDAPDTVELNWFDLSSIEDGVHVYASYSKIDASALPPPTATLAPNTVQYDYTFDMGEVLEERLYFRVAAFNSDAVKVSNEQSIGNPANVLYPDSPTWLFGGGESGYANTLGLDTLFTDTSGTTPVEEYGDTIAMAGNLATEGPDMVQATGPERLVWGRMPVSGVRILRPNNDFTYFSTQTNSVVDENSQSDPDGGTEATRITASSAGGTGEVSISRTNLVAAGVPQSFSVIAKSVSGVATGVRIRYSNYDTFCAAIFDLRSGGSLVSNTGFTSTFIEDIGDGWVRVGATMAPSTDTSGTAAIVLHDIDGGTDSIPLDGTSAIDAVWHQFENSGEVTALQRMLNAYDVTESGTPSVNIAYSDTSDDNWSWDLAAGTYHVFIAGEKGCYFDTVTHAGGEFTVGPTTWTGGPVNAVTDLIGQRYVLVPEYRKDEPFTEFEKAQLVAYAKARGCPGVWNRSGNKLLNGDFSDGSDNWTVGALWSIADGEATVANGATSGANRSISQTNVWQSGRRYIFAFDVTASTFGSDNFLRVGASAAGSVIGSLSLTSDPGKTVGYHSYSCISDGTTFIFDYARTGGGGGQITFDNLAIYELTLESTPT